MACRSSTAQSSITVVATSCWASTSSGWRGTRVCSIAPSRMRPTTTAVSSRSPRYLGKNRPELAASTWWPARPTRWRPAATDFGDSTWTTRSTAPMSIPSSSDDVATSAGSRPVFSISSISSRCSRAIEPWWARAISSSARSFRRWATRSASAAAVDEDERRPVRRGRARAGAGRCAGQIDWRGSPSAAGGAAQLAHVVTGTTTSRSSGFAVAGVDDLDLGRVAAEEAGDLVQRPLGRRESDPLRRRRRPGASSRSSESARCAPRLFAGQRVDLVDDDRLDAAPASRAPPRSASGRATRAS